VKLRITTLVAFET